MKKILLIDTNERFASDVESRLILEEVDDIDIITKTKNLDMVHEIVRNVNPDELLVSTNVLTYHPSWNFGLPVKTYAKNAEGIAASMDLHLPCYGVVKTARELLSAIERQQLLVPEEKKQDTKSEEVSQKKEEVPLVEPAKEEPIKEQVEEFKPEEINAENKTEEKTVVKQEDTAVDTSNPTTAVANQEEQKETVSEEETIEPIDNMEQLHEETPQKTSAPDVMNGQPFTQEQQVAMLEFMKQFMQQNNPEMAAALFNQGGSTSVQINEPATETVVPELQNEPEKNVQPRDLKDIYEENKKRAEEEEAKQKAEEQRAMKEMAMEKIEKDLGHIKEPAKVITVHSAKGGVGKTTISCEMSTFLARTQKSRNINYKVCLVDMDIAYGDVLKTLNFNQRKANVNTWVDDIIARIDNQEPADSIKYSEYEIERFLQRNEQSGLYALVAPASHEMYTKIPEAERALFFDIIIRNLANNGGFDFIVLDTGNNIDDYTQLALKRADTILLVLTQSMSTANCNCTFIHTMSTMGLDFSKVKLVYNQVKKEKKVNISIQDLQQAIVNPETGKEFECYGKLDEYDEVIRAANDGEPMVFNPKHKFTEGIGQIVSNVIGQKHVLTEQPMKKKLFGRNKRK